MYKRFTIGSERSLVWQGAVGGNGYSDGCVLIDVSVVGRELISEDYVVIGLVWRGRCGSGSKRKLSDSLVGVDERSGKLLLAWGDVVGIATDRDLFTALHERRLTISEHVVDVHGFVASEVGAGV